MEHQKSTADDPPTDRVQGALACQVAQLETSGRGRKINPRCKVERWLKLQVRTQILSLTGAAFDQNGTENLN